MEDNKLDRYEQKILVCFRGTKTLQAIFNQNDIGDLETMQAFFSLIKRKIVIPDEVHRDHGQPKISIARENPAGTNKKIKTSQGFFGNVDNLVDKSE